MNPPSLLGHSAQLLRIIRKSPQPADVLTSGYMRDHKYIGASDRRFVSAMVFMCQRLLGSLDIITEEILRSDTRFSGVEINHLQVASAAVLHTDLGHSAFHSESSRTAEQNSKLSEFVAEFLVQRCSLDPEVAKGFISVAEQSLERILGRNDDVSQVCRHAMPLWIIKALGRIYDESTVLSLCRSFLQPAPLFLRVNTLQISRDEVLRRLSDNGIAAEAGRYSPYAICIHERTQLTQTELYASGAIEVQDEGSQIVSLALDVHEHASVLDACAGAGGKSLHIAVLQHDNGRIVASDREPKRMRELQQRASKAGLKSIELKALASADPPANPRQLFDYVLIDAPCSGMGTIRRSPMLKWRLSEDALRRINERQFEIIQQYAAWLKPGGVLEYCTCSILPEENEDIVRRFMTAQPSFSADAVKVHLSAHQCEIPELTDQDFELRLDPLHHQSDGFYIARLLKNAEE